MSTVFYFTFNPFQENTFVIYDETKEAIIIDPGCHDSNEKDELVNWIQKQKLNVQMVLNTHCHIDHVFGNKYITEYFKTGLFIHQGEQPILDAYLDMGAMFGISGEPSPKPSGYLKEGEQIKFGNTRLDILFTPGHSPASISFYAPEDKYLIAGDVLFQGSIGRTDLPGGNYQTLIQSIKTQLLVLPDEVVVYPGHGPATTIGRERISNPFLVSNI